MILDLFKLDGKVAVVTGANTGLGQGMAVALAEAGAKVVGTGRSDFPNQVNNVIAFPGIFKGALEGRATQITEEMKLAAAPVSYTHLTLPTILLV